MWTVIPMTNKLYAMGCEEHIVDFLDLTRELANESDEFERLYTFLNEGRPVIIVTDLEDLKSLSVNMDVVIVNRED